jgi:hypothetical protein
VYIKSARVLDAKRRHTISQRYTGWGSRKMLPRLSQRTYDLMRRAIDAVERDTADLITTMVASAFLDGKNEGASDQQNANAKPKKKFA